MPENTCIFTCVKDQHDEGSSTWECSNCKDVFFFEEGTPEDNHWSFCPAYGAAILDEITEGDEADEEYVFIDGTWKIATSFEIDYPFWIKIIPIKCLRRRLEKWYWEH